jgi:hypothetical protein
MEVLTFEALRPTYPTKAPPVRRVPFAEGHCFRSQRVCKKCNSFVDYVGFEVLTAVIMKSSIFWDITLCSPLKDNRCFGGTCRLHLQGRRKSHERNRREASSKQSPEDGGDMFLRNIGWLSTDYTVWYPRRHNFFVDYYTMLSVYRLHRGEWCVTNWKAGSGRGLIVVLSWY